MICHNGIFIHKNDYERFEEYDEIEIVDAIEDLKTEKIIKVLNKTKGFEISCRFEGSETDVEILIAGGYLNFMKSIREGRCS